MGSAWLGPRANVMERPMGPFRSLLPGNKRSGRAISFLRPENKGQGPSFRSSAWKQIPARYFVLPFLFRLGGAVIGIPMLNVNYWRIWSQKRKSLRVAHNSGNCTIARSSSCRLTTVLYCPRGSATRTHTTMLRPPCVSSSPRAKLHLQAARGVAPLSTIAPSIDRTSFSCPSARRPVQRMGAGCLRCKRVSSSCMWLAHPSPKQPIQNRCSRP